MFNTPQMQEEPPEIRHIKARSRAKLSWITPLCCLALFPVFEATALLVGILLGVIFLIVTFLDMQNLRRGEIFLHMIAGGILTLASVFLLISD